MHQTLKWCHPDTICASFKARAQCYVLGALHSSQHKSGRPVVISCQEAWTAVGIPGGERISALVASNFQNSTLRPNLTSTVASSLAEQQLGVFSHHIFIREGYCHTHTDARIPERSLVAWQTTDEHRCSSSSCTSCRCGSQLLVSRLGECMYQLGHSAHLYARLPRDIPNVQHSTGTALLLWRVLRTLSSWWCALGLAELDSAAVRSKSIVA